MSFINKLLAGGFSTVIDSLSNTVDEFTLSKEEKQDFKLEMQSKLLQMEKNLEDTYRTELESRASIIKAEMAQGDKFTKRARPTIVYAGLVFVFITNVLIPVIAYFSGKTPEEMPQINLPSEFWWAWGTVVSVYGAGRSAEKMGVVNKITQFATGSGSTKNQDSSKAVG